MHKAESALQNEIHKILWDFEILADHSIPARTLDFVLINKKKYTCRVVDFAVPIDWRVKTYKQKE